MVLLIQSVTPSYGEVSQDITLDIVGTGFTVGTIPSLVSPTSPPVTYSLTNIAYISDTELRAKIAAGSLPLGIYDLKVDNGGGITNTLTQSYRGAVDLLDPYQDQTAATILARTKARFTTAPNGKPYDLREGTTVSDMVSAAVPEHAILWDRLARVLKQGFAQFMGGTMLRLRGEEHGVIAKPQTFSVGVVKITAPVNTTLPTGMKFSTTVVANSGVPAITFTSTETAPKTQQNPDTGTVTAATSTSITDNTKNWTVNQWQNLYFWVTTGTAIGQLRKVISNTATQINVSAFDIGQIPDTTSQYQLFAGVDVQADQSGKIGNVAAGAINQLASATSFVTAVTNPVATTSGLDAETDAQFLSRYLLTVRSPSSGGNITDYQRWAQETPGVSIGNVSVLPLWNGNGTVKLVIINADNTIPNAATVTAVQNYIDPTAGQGGGKAPIGAVVTVVAATSAPIDFAVALTIAAGYNGALIRSQVQTAITNYLNSLPVGQSVIFTQLQYAILADPTQPSGERQGITDYDVQSAGHGVKRTGGPSWTQANVVLLGTEKATTGTITVS